MPRPEVEPQLEGEHLQHNPWEEVELLALLPLGFDPDHHDNHDADGEKAGCVCVDNNRVKLKICFFQIGVNIRNVFRPTAVHKPCENEKINHLHFSLFLSSRCSRQF